MNIKDQQTVPSTNALLALIQLKYIMKEATLGFVNALRMNGHQRGKVALATCMWTTYLMLLILQEESSTILFSISTMNSPLKHYCTRTLLTISITRQLLDANMIKILKTAKYWPISVYCNSMLSSNLHAC